MFDQINNILTSGYAGWSTNGILSWGLITEVHHPVVIRATLSNDGLTIVIIFSEITKGNSGFAIYDGASQVTTTFKSRTGTTLTLNLATTAYSTDILYLNYSNGNVLSLSQDDLSAFSAFNITNNSTQITPIGSERATIAKFSGYIRSVYSENYNIYIKSKDGFRLYLGEKLILDKWEFLSQPIEFKISLDLKAGQLTPIRLEYFARPNPQNIISLSWESISTKKTIIPKWAFVNNEIGTDAQINNILLINNDLYSAASDGRIYKLTDIDYLTNSKRYIYAQYRDGAGNETGKYIDSLDTNNIIYDEITQGYSSSVNSQSGGIIYQIVDNSTVVDTFVPSTTNGSLLSPYRFTQQYGSITSQPIYISTLTSWNILSFIATLDAGNSIVPLGLQRGVEINLYVKTANSEPELFSSDWGIPYVYSTINNPSNAGSIDTTTVGVNAQFNISTLSGQWLQYKIVLKSASANDTPILHSINLSYNAANQSYFFTTMINSEYWTNILPTPKFTRGLLTANYIANGKIIFGYSTDDSVSKTFDFSRYTQIEPNTIFTIPTPSNKIRFGILLVSDDSTHKSVVNDLAVQLDAGQNNILLMKPGQTAYY